MTDHVSCMILYVCALVFFLTNIFFLMLFTSRLKALTEATNMLLDHAIVESKERARAASKGLIVPDR